MGPRLVALLGVLALLALPQASQGQNELVTLRLSGSPVDDVITDLSTVSVEAWMERNGVDWHGAQFVELPFPAMEAALEEGRVQAVIQVKPFITAAVESGKARVLGLNYSAVSNRNDVARRRDPARHQRRGEV